MRIKNILIKGLALLSLLVSCSKQLRTNEFELHGILNGTKTKYLLLRYEDYKKNRVTDTLKIVNNTFFSRGFINGATGVWLVGDNTTSSAEDTNSLFLFLEPKRVDITLSENNFKKAIIKGSKTHIEYKNFTEQIKPISKKLRQFRLDREQLVKKKRTSKDSVAISRQIDIIDSLWMLKLKEYSNAKLKFAWDNPNSYLSAYFIDNYFTRTPMDSTVMYYGNLDSLVKIGLYGINIKDKIKKRRPTNVGDIAPKFESLDVSGKPIKLELFKGKYVLLDFWASWCKACREHNPELRELYKTYNSRGLEIISISADDDVTKWKKAILKDSISNWHHINTGRKGLIAIQYNTSYIPYYILIDKTGKIILKELSLEKVNTLLKKKL